MHKIHEIQNLAQKFRNPAGDCMVLINLPAATNTDETDQIISQRLQQAS